MDRVCILSRIRREASKVSSTAVVSGGGYSGVDFDLVVKCASKDTDSVFRRLSSIPDISTEKIAENIIWIREKKNG